MIYKGEDVDSIPTDAMAEEARRGLEWRKKFKRGGTLVGVARARDISNKRELSAETIRRMHSYFSRHEVDKQGQGFSQGEEGYPSAGRIAWALWGGDPGQSWARARAEKMNSIDNRAAPDELKVGDFVRWDSSGGIARGRIEHIMREGVLGIPDSEFSINASEEDPAALIRIYREGDDGFVATETLVGHRFSTLTKIEDLRSQDARPYPNEHAARLTDPGQYDSIRRENDAGGPGIDFIYGIKDGKSELQAIRFDKTRFTPAEARKWLQDHDFSPIEFEEASERLASIENLNENALMDKRHIIGIEETDESVIIEFAKEKHEMEETPAQEAIEEVIEDIAESMPEEEVMAMARKANGKDVAHRSTDMMAEVEDDRRVRMAISSEMGVDRGWGEEVLEHSADAIDLSFLNSGRAPLLLDHDPTKQIGVIESVYLDDRKLRANVRFGRSAMASEVYQDVADNIRGNVSIGYVVNKMVKDEGSRIYRVKSWTPLEVSVVSIPADQSVGVGRASETPLSQPSIIFTGETKMENAKPEVSVEQALAARNKEIQEINALAIRHNQRGLADEAISKGASIEQFRGMLLDKIGDKPLEQINVGMNTTEKRKYSLMSAIDSAVRNGGRVTGFEGEISQELEKRYGKSPRGFYVPTDIFKRDILTTSPANGSNLVPEDFLAGEFVDALRANLVISGLGARMLSGLKGDVAIPAMNAKTSTYFVAENNAPTEGAPSFRQITMSPKTLAAYVDISRKLMMQSSPSADQLIRDDITRNFAVKIDEVAIEGGGANEPTGILGTSGIGSVAIGSNGGNITYAACVNLEREVAIDNALTGNLAYLTNPKVIAKMRSIARQTSGVEGNFILNDANTLLGYNVVSTTSVPSDLTKGTSSGVCSALIFGNFQELMIGMFGGLDILVDPYTGSSTGATRVACFQDIDVAVRHAESFAAIKDITTT